MIFFVPKEHGPCRTQPRGQHRHHREHLHSGHHGGVHTRVRELCYYLVSIGDKKEKTKCLFLLFSAMAGTSNLPEEGKKQC